MKKEILSINVYITTIESIEGEEMSVTMIGFKGDCQGEYFCGEILPGAMDTQYHTKDLTTLGARYMLVGRDMKGEECRLFIENIGRSGEKYTKPRIITDSVNLKWLEKADLEGVLEKTSACLVVKIFEKDI